MTLTEATAICRQFLPREHPEHWKPGLRCESTACEVHGFTPHSIPMPGPTWDLAGAMLEALGREYTQYNSNRVGRFSFGIYDDFDFSLGQAIADNPLDAILIASAEWIQGQKETR